MEKSNLNESGQWLESLVKGEESGFEKIYSHYWSKLYSVAYNYTRSKESAQEIVQEIFISLWLKRQTLSIDVNLKSYLF